MLALSVIFLVGAVVGCGQKKHEGTNMHKWSLTNGTILRYFESNEAHPGFVGGLMQYVELASTAKGRNVSNVGNGGASGAIKLWTSSDGSVVWLTSTAPSSPEPQYVAVIDMQTEQVYGGECMWLPESRLSPLEKGIRVKIEEAKQHGGHSVSEQ
jgi:hypothetical protein